MKENFKRGSGGTLGEKFVVTTEQVDELILNSTLKMYDFNVCYLENNINVVTY